MRIKLLLILCFLLTPGVAFGGWFYSAVDSGADVTAPTLQSSTIGTNGTTWTLAFDEAVSFGAGGNGGWSVTMTTAGAVTLTYSSGSGSSSLVYTGGTTVNSGDTASNGLDYTQPGNGAEDGSGNDLVTINDATVTNNSTQGSCTENLSGNYGTTSGGDTLYSGDAGGFILYQIATGDTGTIDTIKANLQNANSTDREVIFVVYDDDGASGEPGTLLYEGDAIYDAATSGTLAWVTDSPAYCTASSTNLWVGLQFEYASTDINYASGSGELRVISGTFGTIPGTWNAAGDTHYSSYDADLYMSF